MGKIEITHEIEEKCCVHRGIKGTPAPIPQEGEWTKCKEIKDISGLTHGCGCCAPQQGTCKLTLNVKNGIIQEALVETIGCSGMTHSAAIAMRELFLQIVYGRTQSAFSENGLPVGAGLEDLGKGLCSMCGTIHSTAQKGVRYLSLTEGYILKMGLDKNDEVIGYQFVNLGKVMDAIKKGVDPKEAYEKNIGTYGRFADAVKYIDPREE